MKRICYLTDSLSWIQAQRAKDLQPYLPDHHLNVLTPRMIEVSGLSSYEAFWLASWRILLAEPWLGEMLPINRTLLGVTSHYNLGGGLKPETCFRTGTNPAEEFAKAIAILKRFRLVTCNSLILYDLLSPHLPEIVLAQNGVDADYFVPRSVRRTPGDLPRVGWVGKDKGAKNLAAFMGAYQSLDKKAAEFHAIIPKKHGGPVKARCGMLGFYWEMDYLICSSFHDATPNPILEAASCGVPIITTRVGNAVEGLVREGETGWFIDPTAESLIVCIERLQHLEPHEYGRMCEAIRAEIVANWTWEKRAEPYRKALETICAGRALS